MLRIIISIMFLCFVLGGCMSSHEHKTDYSICKALAEYPSYNIHTKAREKEIRKRGVNCRKYASRIDKELSEESLARSSAPRSYNTYSGTSSWDSDRLDRLESAQRNRDYQCIMDGGVPSFGSCL